MECLYAEEAALHNLLPADDDVEPAVGEGLAASRQLQLRVQADTLHGETVFVCGSTPQLGEWQASRALEMHLEDPTTKVWAARVSAPVHKTLEFRYLVGIVLESGIIIVRRWETAKHPRSVSANELTMDRNAAVDMFGNYDGEDKIEPGWLTAESIVHLKMFNSPIVLWKRKYKSVPISYHITPIDLSLRNSDAGQVSEESDQHSNISDFECVKWPVIEIAVMKEGDYEFKKQSQFGNLYVPEDFVIFQAQVLHPSNIAYMVDFYRNAPESSIPEHIGFSYILPGNLRGTCGTCTVPITGNRHQPVGELNVSYLIISPLAGYSCYCRDTYSKFWKKTNRGLDVGHRGSGNARRTDKVENVLENTVASFNYAAKHGADMVELDVQLSKDKVPVIYHDYHICICMKKRKSPLQEEEKLQLAVKDLTVAQLQRLKLSPSVHESHPHHYDFHEDDGEDNQPFPTLQHVLEAVDPAVGFNVEIKCPMQFRDGTWEMDLNFDINQYVDIILRTLLDYSGKRYIILSCFHPDICAMIRLKQNKYPLLFLTQGQTEKYPPYMDTRTSTIQMATYFALCTHILGINVHTEELLREPSLISFVKEHKLILFCWGEDNNHAETITSLKRKGVDGVIYDKLDVLRPVENESVFLVPSGSTASLLEAASCCSRETLPENGMAPAAPCSVGGS